LSGGLIAIPLLESGPTERWTGGYDIVNAVRFERIAHLVSVLIVEHLLTVRL